MKAPDRGLLLVLPLLPLLLNTAVAQEAAAMSMEVADPRLAARAASEAMECPANIGGTGGCTIQVRDEEPDEATSRRFQSRTISRLSDAECTGLNCGNMSLPFNASNFPDAGIQDNAPWGLDRMDQAELPLDNRYLYQGLGSGVNVYVVNSGIFGSHEDFLFLDGTPGNRVRAAYSFDGSDALEDCLGFGTHTAGVIGGLTFGAAKNVTLHSVKVFGCNGTTPLSSILDALDWIADNAEKPAIVTWLTFPQVAQPNDAKLEAIQKLTDAGILVVVPAGSSDTNACALSPSNAPMALTCSGSSATDERAPATELFAQANFGSCVDIFAPSIDIPGPWVSSAFSMRTLSSANVAPAHVAGVASIYLSAHPSTPPAELKAAVVDRCWTGVLQEETLGSGSPNCLCNSNVLQDVPAATPAPTLSPTAAPTRRPTRAPTDAPTRTPTEAPTEAPTRAPTRAPTDAPTEAPTRAPTQAPTQAPTRAPTEAPTEAPTRAPTQAPTEAPTRAPTQAPTEAPTRAPTEAPTPAPTQAPTPEPTPAPTPAPTPPPTRAPTQAPTAAPTDAPTPRPTRPPTDAPTEAPTAAPTEAPTRRPTRPPTAAPTEAPTRRPNPAAPTDAQVPPPPVAVSPGFVPGGPPTSSATPTPLPTARPSGNLYATNCQFMGSVAVTNASANLLMAAFTEPPSRQLRPADLVALPADSDISQVMPAPGSDGKVFLVVAEAPDDYVGPVTVRLAARLVTEEGVRFEDVLPLTYRITRNPLVVSTVAHEAC